jgi:hypothetical protein
MFLNTANLDVDFNLRNAIWLFVYRFVTLKRLSSNDAVCFSKNVKTMTYALSSVGIPGSRTGSAVFLTLKMRECVINVL